MFHWLPPSEPELDDNAESWALSLTCRIRGERRERAVNLLFVVVVEVVLKTDYEPCIPRGGCWEEAAGHDAKGSQIRAGFKSQPSYFLAVKPCGSLSEPQVFPPWG